MFAQFYRFGNTYVGLNCHAEVVIEVKEGGAAMLFIDDVYHGYHDSLEVAKRQSECDTTWFVNFNKVG